MSQNIDSIRIAIETLPGETDHPEMLSRFDLIAAVIRSELDESSHIQSADLTLDFRAFEVVAEHECVGVLLNGTVNGHHVSDKFEFIALNNDTGFGAFLAQPAVWLVLVVWRFFQGNDTPSSIQTRTSAVEGMIASKFVSSINEAVGAPESNTHRLWGMTFRVAGIVFLLGFVSFVVLYSINVFGDPIRPLLSEKDKDAPLIAKLALLLLFSGLLAVPAALSCLCIGPLLISREAIESEAGGFDILNSFGVKTVGGLRVACCFGTAMLLFLSVMFYYWAITGL